MVAGCGLARGLWRRRGAAVRELVPARGLSEEIVPKLARGELRGSWQGGFGVWARAVEVRSCAKSCVGLGIELKSLILAQIERWRHALHMQVERVSGATLAPVANG